MHQNDFIISQNGLEHLPSGMFRKRLNPFLWFALAPYLILTAFAMVFALCILGDKGSNNSSEV